MAEGASDELRAAQSSKPPARVEVVEAEIRRIRERVSVTLTALNGEVRALLDPNTTATLAPVGTRDVTAKIAVGLRMMGQISALARRKNSGPFGIVTAVTGLGVFLSRLGLARRLWNRKKRGHQASHDSSPV